jgi:thioester reductase-like protein
MWPWFIIPSELIGIDWRPVGENVYEQVIVRKDKHPGIQACFYTFPDVDEYSTKDLYSPHPTLLDHWTYVGRADDIIVFSTGEKLNPLTIEGAVMGQLGVSCAQVVGSAHFHAALLIEPIQHPSSEEEKQKFLDGLWPAIEKVNAETVAHGRISRDYVFLSDPNRPFPRAGKGTVQRSLVVKLYADDIEQIFESEKSMKVAAVDMDLTSEAAAQDSIRDLFRTTLKFRELDVDADLFISGVDSLQVLQLSRLLGPSLEKAGVQVSEEAISPRIVYTYPTIAQLAEYIYSLAHANAKHNGDSNGAGNSSDGTTLCDAFVNKYTLDLPTAVPNRPAPAHEGQIIAITGTTGGLGSYLLDAALASPNVSKVVSLNRVADGLARQTDISASRGLSTDFSRVEFLQADLAEPDLGVGAATYARLAGELDRVIHNAWPVNFNMAVASFEPHIRGVRHLVDFSARAARKKVAITFISSVGTIEGWATPDVLVPEKALPDWSVAAMGYGQSKLASSMILDKAAEVSGVPTAIIRVGQIAGPRGEKGKWNPQEWLPSLICSSLYLGMLPDSVGTFNDMGWAPVEDIADVVLEVSGVTTQLPVEKFGGYFHALNPKPTNWTEQVSTLRDFYGDQITKVVPMEEWVDALDKSKARPQDVAKNPGLKLLDAYKALLTSRKGGTLATERTEAYSQTMRKMEAVSPELMRHWCKQWGF